MSMTTAVRFCEPIDPRQVWDTVRSVIDAPAGWQWRRYPPGSRGMGPNAAWFAESGQGAAALAVMYYGAEGAALDDDDDLPPEQTPPVGYVDVHLINGDRNRHPDMLAALTRWTPVPVAIRDDYTGHWSAVHWGGCPV